MKRRARLLGYDAPLKVAQMDSAGKDNPANVVFIFRTAAEKKMKAQRIEADFEKKLISLLDAHTFGLCCRADRIYRGVYNRSGINRSYIEAEFSRNDARDIEQVINELRLRTAIMY